MKKLILIMSKFRLILGISIKKYFFKSWAPYYQEKLYQAPRPLLIQTLDSIKDPRIIHARQLASSKGRSEQNGLLLEGPIGH